MLGSSFLTYVKKKFLRSDKDSEIYEATTDIIADMRVQFNSEDFKTESYTAEIGVLGDYSFDLPTSFGHIIGEFILVDVDSNSNRILNKISKSEYDRKYGDRLYATVADRNSSEPIDFSIYGGQAFVGPVPDKITYKYNINYTTEDYVEITGATADVPFSDKYRNILRDGVLYQMHDLMENFQEADRYRLLYLEGLGKIINNDQSNISDNDSVAYNGV